MDTKQQGGHVKTSLKSLALARAEKGPMSSKNLYFTLRKTDKKYNLKTAIISAIKTTQLNISIHQLLILDTKGFIKQVLR